MNNSEDGFLDREDVVMIAPRGWRGVSITRQGTTYCGEYRTYRHPDGSLMITVKYGEHIKREQLGGRSVSQEETLELAKTILVEMIGK